MTAPTSGDLQRVRLLLEAARWDDAVRALAPVLAQTPDDAEPRCLLAQAYLGMRRPADAVVAAEQALAVDPSSSWAVRLHALALHNDGRHVAAIVASRQLVAADPGEWRAWWVLSVSARGFGPEGVPESLTAAQRAVALGPEHGDVHDAYGSALLAAGDVAGAEAAFRRALALDPTDAYAHNGLGQAALQRKDPAAAADGFRRALLADPRESAARHNLRVALQQALRPLTFVILLCAVGVRLATSGTLSALDLRLAGVAASVVATVALGWSVRTAWARLDPTLRRYYGRLVRTDRRLAAGLAAHVVAVAALYAVIVAPAGADGTLGAVAFLAAIVGRILVLRLRRR